MRVDELDYDLPADRIATAPARPRDAARMMVVRRKDDAIDHRRVRDLPDYLDPRDVLIVNDTAVLPAGVEAKRTETGGRVEGLYLDRETDGAWRMLLRSNGRLRPGHSIELLARDGAPAGVVLRLVEREAEGWRVTPEPIDGAGEAPDPSELLLRVGRTPLPPYIRRARSIAEGPAADVDERDRAWYETIYADAAKRASVAAPTAGLHFTPELLERIRRLGVGVHAITLHVGPGTFQPVKAETLDAHPMHEEVYSVGRETIEAIDRAREAGGRAIAVGTTTVRALESLPDRWPNDAPSLTARTRLLIAPGHGFRRVDAMLTNFHLPRSTLLALVAAFLGLERVRAAYTLAVERGYRFYSYGDAMLLLPA